MGLPSAVEVLNQCLPDTAQETFLLRTENELAKSLDFIGDFGGKRSIYFLVKRDNPGEVRIRLLPDRRQGPLHEAHKARLKPIAAQEQFVNWLRPTGERALWPNCETGDENYPWSCSAGTLVGHSSRLVVCLRQVFRNRFAFRTLP